MKSLRPLVANQSSQRGHKPQDGKVHKRGKAACALQLLWFSDSEQFPQDATEIVRCDCHQVTLTHLDQSSWPAVENLIQLL